MFLSSSVFSDSFGIFLSAALFACAFFSSVSTDDGAMVCARFVLEREMLSGRGGSWKGSAFEFCILFSLCWVGSVGGGGGGGGGATGVAIGGFISVCSGMDGTDEIRLIGLLIYV